jgi:hypothetical protein
LLDAQGRAGCTRTRGQPLFEIYTWNKYDDVLGEWKITNNNWKNMGYNMLDSKFEEEKQKILHKRFQCQKECIMSVENCNLLFQGFNSSWTETMAYPLHGTYLRAFSTRRTGQSKTKQ